MRKEIQNIVDNIDKFKTSVLDDSRSTVVFTYKQIKIEGWEYCGFLCMNFLVRGTEIQLDEEEENVFQKILLPIIKEKQFEKGTDLLRTVKL